MNYLNKISVKTQLAATLGGLCLLIIAAGVLGLQGMKATQAGLATVYDDRVVPLKQLKVIADLYAVNIVDTSHKVRNGNMSFADGAKSVDEAVQRIGENWNAYLATRLVDREQKLVAETRPVMAKADVAVSKLSSILAKQQKDALADFTVNELYAVIDPVSGKMAELVDVQLEVAKNEYDRAVAGYGFMQKIVLAAISLGAAFAAILGFALVRSITQPLRTAVDAAQKITEGDLTAKIELTHGNEFGKLLHALQAMCAGLGRTFSTVNSGAEQVASAATQLAAASLRVTKSSHAQSEVATGTAVVVQKVTAGIDAVAKSALDVRALSKTSLEQTRQGNQKMAVLVEEIKRVETAVKDIAGAVNQFVSSANTITGMTKEVKDIAEQTNLLALNAAIEAARAGEQGRGFAVVADEVRKLAEKSAASAGQIDAVTQTLGVQSANVEKAIDSGLESLESSRGHVETVVNMLASTTELVANAAKGVESITAAVNEQTAGSNHIVEHAKRIVQMAEENHVSVSESSEAAGTLEQMTQRLQNAMPKFKWAGA
jgi:methyl-accepting chemotaxis protein